MSGKMAPEPTEHGSLDDGLNYKNQLQEYTQKLLLPLPVYNTIHVICNGASLYRSTVLVEEATYASSVSCSTRKAAEQEAAKLALQSIKAKENTRNYPIPLSWCKSILHEYATYMKVEKPVFSTSQLQWKHPAFICSVSFNGQTYTGEKGKNKKEAEQLAACAAIESLLGSSSGDASCQFVKSKLRRLSTLLKNKANTSRLTATNSLAGTKRQLESEDHEWAT